MQPPLCTKDSRSLRGGRSNRLFLKKMLMENRGEEDVRRAPQCATMMNESQTLRITRRLR